MDFGVVTENDSTVVIDHNKVKRAQTELVGMVTESKDDELKKNGLDNLLFPVCNADVPSSSPNNFCDIRLRL